MASGKAGKRARKRLLPEREETWELGNGKGQGHPLPAHSFLSPPPPPPANTWHGHKQGLCSLPLGRDLVKEAKADSKERSGGGLTGLPLLNHGQAGLPSGVGGWLFSPSMPQARRRSPSSTAAGPEEAGTMSSLGGLEGGAGARGLGGGTPLSVVFFLTPSCSALLSMLLPTPPLPFLHRYCSHNFRKLKGKNKGSHGASSVQYHLPCGPKTAQEELTPPCPQPWVTF